MSTSFFQSPTKTIQSAKKLISQASPVSVMSTVVNSVSSLPKSGHVQALNEAQKEMKEESSFEAKFQILDSLLATVISKKDAQQEETVFKKYEKLSNSKEELQEINVLRQNYKAANARVSRVTKENDVNNESFPVTDAIHQRYLKYFNVTDSQLAKGSYDPVAPEELKLEDPNTKEFKLTMPPKSVEGITLGVTSPNELREKLYSEKKDLIFTIDAPQDAPLLFKQKPEEIAEEQEKYFYSKLGNSTEEPAFDFEVKQWGCTPENVIRDDIVTKKQEKLLAQRAARGSVSTETIETRRVKLLKYFKLHKFAGNKAWKLSSKFFVIEAVKVQSPEDRKNVIQKHKEEEAELRQKLADEGSPFTSFATDKASWSESHVDEKITLRRQIMDKRMKLRREARA